MRFEALYVLEQLDTVGVFRFGSGDDRRVIQFRYEQDLGIPEELHFAASALFSEVAAESRSEK